MVLTYCYIKFLGNGHIKYTYLTSLVLFKNLN